MPRRPRTDTRPALLPGFDPDFESRPTAFGRAEAPPANVLDLEARPEAAADPGRTGEYDLDVALRAGAGPVLPGRRAPDEDEDDDEAEPDEDPGPADDDDDDKDDDYGPGEDDPEEGP